MAENLEYEYVIYDPEASSIIIPYSNTKYVPDSVVDAVQTIHQRKEKFIYLTKYLGTDSVVHIPENIEQLPVRAVNSFSLKKFSFIKRLYVPKTVCYFHPNSLKGCTNLEQILLAVNEEKEIVFSGVTIQKCKKLFHNGICIVNGELFADPDYSNLYNLTVSSEVRKIGDYAFRAQCGVQKIKIPNTVSTIGTMAFFNCRDLETVEIEGSPLLTGMTFCQCNELKKVIIHGPLNLISGYRYLFSDCENIETFQVPEGTTSISECFYRCESLREVHIPNTVEEIGHFAFCDCNALRSLIIPESVKLIKSSAFHSCGNLKTVVFLSNYISIENGAFSNCPNVIFYGRKQLESEFLKQQKRYTIVERFLSKELLTSIAYRKISEYAFKDYSLAIPKDVLTSSIVNEIELKFKFPANLTFFNDECLYDMYTAYDFYISKKKAVREIRKLDPEDTTEAFMCAKAHIEPNAPILSTALKRQYLLFWNNICLALQLYAVQSKIIAEFRDPNNSAIPMIRIASAAVVDKSCRVLELIATRVSDLVIEISPQLVDFSDKEKFEIEHDLFAMNPEIFSDYIIFPENKPLGSMKIAYRSFGTIDSEFLQKNEYKNSVSAVPDDFAQKESQVQNVIIPSSIHIVEPEAFCNSPVQYVEISEGVTEIQHGAFESCTQLKKIMLPSTLELIGEYAFSNCNSLETIECPQNVNNLAYAAFSGCKSLQSFSAPPLVTHISDRLLEKCIGLKEISFSDAVTSIGAHSFSHCESLTEIILPESIVHIEYSAFSDCKNLRHVILPTRMITLQGRVFKGCNKLEAVSIPQGITSIGNWMFKECTSLRDVKLPDTIKKIGEEAFFGCENLEKLVLPDSVDEIEKNAFMDCKVLKEIILPPNMKKIAGNPFPTQSGFTLYVKKGGNTEKMIMRRKIPSIFI